MTHHEIFETRHRSHFHRAPTEAAFSTARLRMITLGAYLVLLALFAVFLAPLAAGEHNVSIDLLAEHRTDGAVVSTAKKHPLIRP